LDDGSQHVLRALAVLGGHASRADLGAVVAIGSDGPLDVDKPLDALRVSGWLEAGSADQYALSSATHRDTVIRSMNDSEFAALHRAAAEFMEQRNRPLAAASAAVHYVLAGDATRAREVARLAAASTRAIGLEATAASFDALSEKDDIDALAGRNLFGAELKAGRTDPPRPSRGARTSDPARGSRRPRAASSRPSRPPRVSEPPRGTPSQPPARALEALRKGDTASVDKLAQELRVDEGRSGLAERLEAIADLARGDTGDAIRRLRDAAGEAKRAGSRDQCRALLAFAVALGAAGRKEEALLEALDALARARDGNDERGERACLRFLSQLAANAGHPSDAWVAPGG
jgi:hypothetical protein